MKAFRYNSKKREDRKFNTCGKEKNPNAIKFYALNMNYADNYKFIYNEDGDIIGECTLEIVDIENINIFNMSGNFKTLVTFNNYIAYEIGTQLKDYTIFMNNAKKVSDRKMWAKNIDNLKNREAELILNLKYNEFQTLSDFERQNELVAELKTLGFNGYITNNEIAIF
jgi:hypothetical protein